MLSLIINIKHAGCRLHQAGVLIQPGDHHHLDSSAAPSNQPLITLADPAAFANILEDSSKPHLILQANEKKI